MFYGLQALVCVFADSVVRTFSPAGEKLHFFSLGDSIKSEGGIIQVCFGAPREPGGRGGPTLRGLRRSP